LRPRARPGLRAEDRGWDAAGGAARPRGDRGLSGRRGVVALLQLENVEARYGQVKALHGVSLRVPEGRMVAVLGANGAGKTTTLRAISNVVKKTGEVVFDGRRITRSSPETIARLGIAHVPEGRGIVKRLTVDENLRLGAYARKGAGKADRDRVLAAFPT